VFQGAFKGREKTKSDLSVPGHVCGGRERIWGSRGGLQLLPQHRAGPRAPLSCHRAADSQEDENGFFQGLCEGRAGDRRGKSPPAATAVHRPVFWPSPGLAGVSRPIRDRCTPSQPGSPGAARQGGTGATPAPGTSNLPGGGEGGLKWGPGQGEGRLGWCCPQGPDMMFPAWSQLPSLAQRRHVLAASYQN